MSVAPFAAGYILRQQPYRNTSLLLEAFTAEAGRIGLIARGVRRNRSRTGALLAPFQPLLLQWQGRGELKTLAGVEEAGKRHEPSGRALFAGYYCNELILRLLERDSVEPGAFVAYQQVMAQLSGEVVPEAALRNFELDLLDALGYAPLLDHTTDGAEAVEADAMYEFTPEQGPVRVVDDSMPGAVRVSGSQLLALAHRQFDDAAVLTAARRVLRMSLDPLLGSRPLKTREMYRRIYGSSGASAQPRSPSEPPSDT